MQIGIHSFAAAYDDTSLAVSASDRLRNLIEQIEHADQQAIEAIGTRVAPALRRKLDKQAAAVEPGTSEQTHSTSILQDGPSN